MKLCDTYGMLLGIIVTEILDLASIMWSSGTSLKVGQDRYTRFG